MLRITATLSMLLLAVTLLPLSASAQAPVEGEGAMQLPPPPGPYLSSRPQLDAHSIVPANSNHMPFVGNMPSMPMRTMPRFNQLPTPPPWWRGPVGR